MVNLITFVTTSVVHPLWQIPASVMTAVVCVATKVGAAVVAALPTCVDCIKAAL